MASATLTSKGQMTIPMEIRDFFSLKAGDRLDFVIRDGKEVVVLPSNAPVDALKGILRRKGRGRVSVERMNAVIRKRSQGGR